MIKLNRTTEYGLMALRHMNRKRGLAPVGSQECSVTSAREIADSYGLPFEITAKTLQRLKDTGLIQSAQGARGGYTLQRYLEDVSLAEFLELMEGPQSVVACAPLAVLPSGPSNAAREAKDSEPGPEKDCSCEYERRCEIKQLMTDLNGRVKNFLSSICLADLAGNIQRTSE